MQRAFRLYQKAGRSFLYHRKVLRTSYGIKKAAPRRMRTRARRNMSLTRPRSTRSARKTRTIYMEKRMIMEDSYRFFQNDRCEYFPCHKGLEEFNCLFCYCPLYHLKNCPGSWKVIELNGRKIKECTDCTFPHKPENYERIIRILSAAGKNAEDG